MNKIRRLICKISATIAGTANLTGCFQSITSPHPSKEKPAKFQGIRGYERFISGFGKTQQEGVVAVFFDKDDNGIETGNFWEKRNSKSSAAIKNPEELIIFKATAFEPNTAYRRDDIKDWFKSLDGKIIGQWTVNASARIPDELLEDLRRDPKGMLRIKLRLHRDGLLLGWDIERRTLINPVQKSIQNNLQYDPPEFSFAGGDFREAEIYNGQVIKKGWYIHPKTGERIETDF